jgi:hypothetical protein
MYQLQIRNRLTLVLEHTVSLSKLVKLQIRSEYELFDCVYIYHSTITRMGITKICTLSFYVYNTLSYLLFLSL